MNRNMGRKIGKHGEEKKREYRAWQIKCMGFAIQMPDFRIFIFTKKINILAKKNVPHQC